MGAFRLHLCLHCAGCFCAKRAHHSEHFQAFSEHCFGTHFMNPILDSIFVSSFSEYPTQMFTLSLPLRVLALDTSNDQLYCLLCSNYVFHPIFEEITRKSRHFAVSQFQKLTSTCFAEGHSMFLPQTLVPPWVLTNFCIRVQIT